MASSSQLKRPHDVFLSFRGPDTRHTILSHIYKALNQSGINTFLDNEKLKKGERISPALIKAIEESCIAVILFSQNFALSPWCLDEVVKIMECKERNNLIVLPVFYYVDPREVREGRQKYKEAFDKHEKKYSSEDVTKWKAALADAGNLFGSELNVWVVAEPPKETIAESPKETNIQLESRDFKVMVEFRKGTSVQLGNKEFKDEAELVESIVREIWIQLKPRPLDVAKFPVGIDSRVNELILKLNMESQEESLTLGLRSMGGMGKTTLARALYNYIFKDFEGSAYVDGIKGTLSQTKNMVRLQKKLLSQMLMKKEISLTSDAEGSILIPHRLGHKRVLLILDGVDDICQIDSLAREHDWFGKGSRIIITTTDEGLLDMIGASSHTVEPLGYAEARELIMKHASGNRKNKIENFVDRALLYAQGVPLALEVLGRAFATSKENEWKGKLETFAKSSDKSIDKVLRISYDGLNYNEQEIFLHIACFFNGWSRRYVERVLKNCDLAVDTGVSDLIRRSLIMDENGILKVHDLIELMGKNIVVRECDDDAAKRSRLWRLKDVRDILSGDEGTDVVKAIVLAPSKPEKIDICSEAFAKLKNLRFLIMINVETDFRDPIRLPRKLRWFEWPECPASSIILNSPNNLAVLTVRRHLFKEPEER